MYRLSLISLTAIAMSMMVPVNANAQSARTKQFSLGPAIEVTGNGTSFGIQGKVRVAPHFSVRPIVLFDYTPGVSRTDIINGSVTSNSDTSVLPPDILIPVTVGGNPAAVYGKNTSGTSTKSPAVDPKNPDQNTINTLQRVVPSGLAYGTALTYDFTSPKSKFSGYVGPRFLFASASGKTQGGVSTSASETNIGLIAGVDYAISTNVTAGLNATYDFFRSGSYTLTRTKNGTYNIPISDGDFRIGINFGYGF